MKPVKCMIWSGRIENFAPPVIPLSMIALLLAVGFAGSALPATNTVTSLADNGVGSLRQMIADSTVGDSIVFGVTGTITLTSGELVVAKSLTIIGPGNSALVISGNASSRIFNINSNVTALISDLTIRDGRARDGTNGTANGGSPTAGGPGEPGGAIITAGSLALWNCVVTANRAGNGGYGFSYPYPQIGSPTPGGAGGAGGAIYNSGDLWVSNCVIAGNATGAGASGDPDKYSGADGMDGGYGGGIFSATAMAMNNCTVSNNMCGRGGSGGSGQVWGGRAGSGGSGGGVYAQSSFVMIGCTIVSNQAGLGGDGGDSHALNAPGGSGGFGGGIYSEHLMLTNCTVHGNSAGNGGVGGVVDFVHGTGTGGPGGCGGGICGVEANQFVVACTIVNNAVGLGGLGWFHGPDGQGGGVYAARAGVNGGILNNIVALNSGPSPDVSGVFNSLGHNLIGVANGSSGFTATGDLAGSDAFPLDPKVAPLADNGGPTMTKALLAGSPAIDAGATLGVPAADQRGVARPQGSAVDIGAYEFQYTTPRITGPRFQTPTSFWLQSCGLPDQTYTLQTSTNLSSWTDLTNILTGSNGMSELVDPNVGNFGACFYRLKLPAQ